MKSTLILSLLLALMFSCKSIVKVVSPDREIGFSGTGLSPKNAVLIKYAKSSSDWLNAQKDFLNNQAEKKGEVWNVKEKKMISNADGVLDEVYVEILEQDSTFKLYFIVNFFAE